MVKKAIYAISLAVVLVGCDYSLEISGTLDLGENDKDTTCKMFLMNEIGPIWSSEKKPNISIEREIGRQFKLDLVIGGPTEREHWVEIKCPGYKTYKSKVFLAPTKPFVISSQPDLNNP